MGDKKVAWLWGYVKYNEREPLGYVISLGDVLLNIKFVKEKNSWVCIRRDNGSLLFSFPDLVSIIKELGKSADVAWMFGYASPRTYSLSATLLVPAISTGAVAKDIPTYSDFSEELKMSWFSGLNSDGEACIVSVKGNKVEPSFTNVTEALENRAGKYINIIGQDNKILLRAKNMRKVVNNSVVYPNPLMVLANYYESIAKNNADAKSTENRGIKSVEAYKSAFIDKIELKGDTSNGRYQLLKYYGHFGKYKSSIAVIDMLMAHNTRAKESDTQWMRKHSLLNTFNTAFDFDKKSDKSHQGVLLRYLRYFDGYQLLSTYNMGDVRSVYTNWLSSAFNVTRSKIARTARHDEERGLGYERVLRVPREILDIIRKFDNQIHDVCKEVVGEEECEYMVRDVHNVVKSIIKTGNLAYINAMNTFVEYPETRAETVLNIVLALHDIPIDWAKNSTIRSIWNAIGGESDDAKKDFLKTFLFLVSACAPCLEGRGKDGCSITGWRMKDAVWCIYKSLEGRLISEDEDYDPYRLIEMATVFDSDPYEGVVGMFSEQIYTVLCEFLCEIITYITKKALSERQTPSYMYAWFGSQLDFGDTVNYGFYTEVSTVALIARNFDGAKLNIRACGLRDYIYYHKYNYMVGVITKVLELSGIKDAGKYAVEIVTNLDERTGVLWNTCLVLRYKYLNPVIDMSGHKKINTLFTVYNSTAFVCTDTKATKFTAQYPEKDIIVPSNKGVVKLYSMMDGKDVTKGFDNALHTFVSVALKYCK